jgi:hypothetical protein
MLCPSSQLTSPKELLAPITSAAELPSHPALSTPYNEKGLPEMIQNTEDALHREQRILWKMKALFTEFRGDAVWAPVGMFHTGFDDMLLGSHRMSASSATLSTDPVPNTGTVEGSALDVDAELSIPDQPIDDIPMIDDAPADEIIVSRAGNTIEIVQENTNGAVEHATNGDITQENNIPTTNGTTSEAPDAPMLDPTEDPSDDIQHGDGDNDSSAPSHRMTTRARAQEPTHSPTPSLSPQIHPFFEFPNSAIPDANLGLPIHMADQTRNALISYISKQEEIVRSYKELHEGLLKALEMRTNVWNWTRAEGHEGEMSDHEDWVDLEAWGIEEKDFRKGMLEDEGEEAEEERRKRVPRRVGRAANKD